MCITLIKQIKILILLMIFLCNGVVFTSQMLVLSTTGSTSICDVCNVCKNVCNEL